MSVKNRKLLVIISLAVLIAGSANADTLTLGQGDWQSPTASNATSQKIAEFKQAIDQGQIKKALTLTNKLKQIPALSGPDFDSYVNAEILFAKKKFLKAVKAYNQFMDASPDSVLFESALERQFDIATAFFSGVKVRRLKILKLKAYEEAEKILEKIADRAGDAPISRRALIALAKHYENTGNFLMAYQTWSDISGRWPTGQIAKQALYGMARSLHSSYRGPKFAAVNLESAKSYYRDFKIRYAADASELEIDNQIKLAEEQKAYKEFETGRFYDKTEKDQAGNLYYRSVIDQWPRSAAAQHSKRQMRKQQTEKPQNKKRTLAGWWFEPTGGDADIRHIFKKSEIREENEEK
jgi:outer membrane protein assembly factor BamD (BamD/ComL family)